MVVYASYVCFMHPRFTDNPPIDLEAMDPSVLRWFCHKWEERTNLARIVGYHNKNFREESEKLGGGGQGKIGREQW
jgi:hypothetical protein